VDETVDGLPIFVADTVVEQGISNLRAIARSQGSGAPSLEKEIGNGGDKAALSGHNREFVNHLYVDILHS
jgi:hypothetical protein